MIQVLAALPAILSAIAEVPALFEKGKEVFQTVTGQAPTSAKPEELAKEVANLPADKMEVWVRTMQAELDAYKAETDRLKEEQGEVTAELLQVLDPKTAAKVAYLRMATRPRVVLMMARVMLLPVYLMAVDGAITLVNILLKGLGSALHFELLAPAMVGDGGSIHVLLYKEAAPWATIIVVAYMASRLAEKLFTKENTPAISGTPTGIMGGFAAIAGVVKNIVSRKK